MADRPLISAIITVFERTDFLAQAIESVLAQTRPPDEVIVVDDGSREVFVKGYEIPDGAKFIHHEVQRGASAARNTGIKASTGDFLTFLDDDDVWLPDKLEAQECLLLQNPGVAMTYCHARLVDRDLAAFSEQPPLRTPDGDSFVSCLHSWLSISPSTWMARREAVVDAGMFDESVRYNEDWDLYTRIAQRHQLLADPEVRILYRRHSLQLSEDPVGLRLANIAFRRKWLRWAKAERPDLVPRLRRWLCRDYQLLAKDFATHRGDTESARTAIADAVRAWPFDARAYGGVFRIPGWAKTPR